MREIGWAPTIKHDADTAQFPRQSVIEPLPSRFVSRQ
jgi:hypothetical protein